MMMYLYKNRKRDEFEKELGILGRSGREWVEKYVNIVLTY